MRFALPGQDHSSIGGSLRLLHGIRRAIEKVIQPGSPHRCLQLMRQLYLEGHARYTSRALSSLLQLLNVMILHYGVSHALPPTTLPDIVKLLVHDIIGYKLTIHTLQP